MGKPKAEVAADFIMARVPGVTVTPHFCKIEDKDRDFYEQFHIIVLGLDSVEARRWMNSMIHSFVQYDDEARGHHNRAHTLARAHTVEGVLP